MAVVLTIRRARRRIPRSSDTLAAGGLTSQAEQASRFQPKESPLTNQPHDKSGDEAGVAGVVEDVKGKAKEAVGKLTGDSSLRDEGRAQQDKAEAERDVAKQEARADAKRAEADAREAEQRARQKES